MDYSELVEALRLCQKDDGCESCAYKKDMLQHFCWLDAMSDAADAIVALGLDSEDYEHENRRLHGEIEALQDTVQAQEKALRQLAKRGPKRGDFEKKLHDMFETIWDREIDHPIFQDTVGDLMEAVLQAFAGCVADMRKMEEQDEN